MSSTECVEFNLGVNSLLVPAHQNEFICVKIKPLSSWIILSACWPPKRVFHFLHNFEFHKTSHFHETKFAVSCPLPKITLLSVVCCCRSWRLVIWRRFALFQKIRELCWVSWSWSWQPINVFANLLKWRKMKRPTAGLESAMVCNWFLLESLAEYQVTARHYEPSCQGHATHKADHMPKWYV